MGPKFIAKIEEVKALLTEADGYYNSGRYDLAHKKYDQVLNLDPYNVAARRGQEKLDNAKYRYGEEAYNETRARNPCEVEQSWEEPVRQYGQAVDPFADAFARDASGTARITTKLNTIIIPRVEFRDASIREAIDFLRQQAVENDPATEGKKGVDIVLRLAPLGQIAPPPVPVQPAQSPLTAAPAGAGAAAPGTAPATGGAPATARPAGTGKDTQESTGGQQLVNREGAKEYLEALGVPFPEGASANFLPESSRLIVRNTQDNLDLVDALVEQANLAVPKQVEIESKFVEITQNNLKELGFDWLLGPFNIGNHKVFGSGGTAGTGVPINSANFPFNNPNPTGGPGTPIAGDGTAGGPVTAGNRSGNIAISANAIDALLFPTLGASSVATGIFGLAGVFTDPQFQVVIRALNQKKGVDLLSAPKVTTKSGQRAVIEIVREFRYPTTFTPPQVASITGGTGGTGTVSIEVVTPTTPQTFETRNTGVTLEVEPVVGPDGVTIDLNLVPQVVEFEGFINYGSAIFGVNPNLVSGTTVPTILLTNNVINQPIFSTRKVTTSVSVWDGQTVVLGGLMREDVQKTEDKVPIIGDIPLLGRLFRNNVDQHIKRNLVIFVTARLVNPGGLPVNPSEEEEEGLLQPPVLPEVPAYKK